MRVSASGFDAAGEDLVIPSVSRHEHTLRLKAAAAWSTLQINVTDAEGKPVEARVRMVDGPVDFETGPDGVGKDKLPAGKHELVISAEGYGVARRSVEAKADSTASLDVVLKESRVRLTETRVVILDKVFFEFDSAVIKPESIGLLDEVAATMLDHPELRRVEVQGHTDDQGTDEYNKKLSQDRAEAVMNYLVSTGVPGNRLTATGYGEAQPLQKGITEDARATNRRVEFHIIDRDGATPPPREMKRR